jgi:hypothetical protein
MRQTVINHKNLVRINESFIVNEDDDAYKAALARRAMAKKTSESEARIAELERKLEALMKFVEGNNNAAGK